MALSEIPSKVIERTEALTETKLEVACELTKLIYATAKEKDITKEEILDTYINFYNSLKEFVPSPLDKISPKKLNLYFLLSTIIFVVLFGLYLLLKNKF